MNFYWVYDIPNWLFGILSITAFTAFGIGGLFITRKWIRRLHLDQSYNDIVGYYLGAIILLYGITLGLVAAGSWTTFTGVEDKVSDEAQVLASIYRDVDNYKEPFRTELKKDLKDYVYHVIYVNWPQQKKGLVPLSSDVYLDRFQKHLITFQPQVPGDQIIQEEVLRQFNLLVEFRRARLNLVDSGLPTAIWYLVIFGGLLSIIVSLFFNTRNFWMHVWMTALLSVLIGLMVFLVGTLDCPFRGSVSVKPTPLELIYQQFEQSTP